LKQLFTIILFSIIFTTSCTSCEAQTEQQALEQLRMLTKDGNLPQESVVLSIENRFSNQKTGALAKLLRARIRLQNLDGNGAAEIANSNVIKQKTTLGDYALWLRGKGLMQATRYNEAVSAFQQLTVEFPASLRLRDAKLLWAESALNGGQPNNIQNILQDLLAKNDVAALLLLAKSFEASGNQANAITNYRKLYFVGAGSNEAKEAETKLTTWQQILTPNSADEAIMRFEKLIAAKNYVEAEKALLSFPINFTAAQNVKRIVMYSSLRKMNDAQNAFNLIPLTATEKLPAYNELAKGYANARLWPNARTVCDEMRRNFATNAMTPKTFVQVGMIARDAKNKLEENYYLQTTLSSYPNAVEIAQVQFEFAWMSHDAKNYLVSSQQLTEHLARYADKDTTYRGRAGYWSARDSELAGKIAEACALYDGLLARYDSNWYGYLAAQRITALRSQGKCTTLTAPNPTVAQAVANLKKVTVAAETSTAKEQEKIVKSSDLGTIGLFDWAIDELNDAQRTAPNSPKVNLGLARLYRLKFDKVNALLALAKSYPDYSQMKPEELSREEWDIFYQLTDWNLIKQWATARNLDKYQIAGFIRQESVFNPRAKSHANAYGLMQLLIPTAKTLAKQDGLGVDINGESLFQPAINIQLGTKYIRQQFDRFGRIEYVACAYNAGPNRVPQWTSTLPFEIDEFVEAIPFKETKGYVQGVIRNSAQYRRLYDENGQFKPNVGTKPLRNEIDTKTRDRIAEEFPDVRIDDSVIAEEEE
jgi:soluble lytic murein transglycosylase